MAGSVSTRPRQQAALRRWSPAWWPGGRGRAASPRACPPCSRWRRTTGSAGSVRSGSTAQVLATSPRVFGGQLRAGSSDHGSKRWNGRTNVRTPRARRTAAQRRYGMRIAVVQGTVYDVHLTRSLHHAELIRSLSSRGALERSDATLKIREGGANAMEQDGLAQFVGLHGWRLDGPYIEPPFALAEQLNAKFPAPPGEAFLGRQLHHSRSPIGQRSEGPSRAPAPPLTRPNRTPSSRHATLLFHMGQHLRVNGSRVRWQ